jgi:DNA/RNA-binding domain of Phe-tRNA-synthetase-like protein
MISVTIQEELKMLCPNLRLGCIEADVKVSDSDESLLASISNRIQEIHHKLSVEDISKIPVITDSRKAYKACGKDPARYRLSAEALLRRVVSGKSLYQINNVVDQLNLVSISTGFSIGGYDVAQIQGEITFGIGRADEPYQGIGRGDLNIEFLPVFRDQFGTFGTPTSDSQRTGVTSETSQFLMVLIDFGNSRELEEAMQMAVDLLAKYCHAKNVELSITD